MALGRLVKMYKMTSTCLSPQPGVLNKPLGMAEQDPEPRVKVSSYLVMTDPPSGQIHSMGPSERNPGGCRKTFCLRSSVEGLACQVRPLTGQTQVLCPETPWRRGHG